MASNQLKKMVKFHESRSALNSLLELILFFLQWEQEKWKFESGNHVMLIHKASGKALHVTSSGVIEAGADPSSKMSTGMP